MFGSALGNGDPKQRPYKSVISSKDNNAADNLSLAQAWGWGMIATKKVEEPKKKKACRLSLVALPPLP